MASAYQLSPEVNAEFDAIIEHNYRGSPQSTPPTCSAVCQDLWAAERRTGAVDTSSVKQLNREMRTLRVVEGISPALRVLGTVGLGVEAGILGWKIGSGINAKFLKIGIPEQPDLSSYFLSYSMGWLNNGDTITHAGVAPVSAFYLHSYTSSGNTLNGFLRGNPSLLGACATNFDHGGGPEWTDVITGTATCFQGYFHPTGVRDVHAYYRRAEDLEAPGPVEDYSDQLVDVTSPAPTDPGTSVVTGTARTELESGDYPKLNQMVEFELGTPGVCDPVEEFVCNPSPSQDEQDRRCELSTPGNADPAPARGTTPFQPPLYDEVLPFTRRQADGSITSTALKYGWTLPSTKKGWRGWGYRHIYAKHGWSAQDIAATQVALQLPPIPGGSPTRAQYTGPEYRLNGAICVRRVVVAFDKENQIEPEPAEIITSYGRWVREAP